MKLLDYIRGSRKGKEAHRLEKEAMRDPFLADALEGYSRVEGDPTEQIERLRRQISIRTARKYRLAVIWSIAASLLIGIGISTYILFQEKALPEGERIAMEQIPQSEPVDLKRENVIPELAKTTLNDSTKSSQKLISENRKKKISPSIMVRPKAVTQEMMKEEEVFDTVIAEEVPVKMKSSAAKVVVAADSVFDNKLIASSGKIRGKVVDEEGEPLIGASVLLKDTQQGTVTDKNGNFTLKIDGDRELVVDYIGYESLTLPVDTTKNLLIAMNEDRNVLDEVVVVKKAKRSDIPQPVIGQKAFKQYLKNHLIHPSNGECAHVKGKVLLTFWINKKGRPVSISVKKSLCATADKEAIRLINEGPDWTLGNEQVEVSIRF